MCKKSVAILLIILILSNVTITAQITDNKFSFLSEVNQVEVSNTIISWTDINFGTCVKFGNMKWYVIGVDNEKYELWSKDIICEKEFNDTKDNDWENSSLRKWLNSEEFLSHNRFTVSEIEAIIPVKYECILTEETKERAIVGNRVMKNVYYITQGDMYGGEKIELDYNNDIDIWKYYSMWTLENRSVYLNDVIDRVRLPREDEVAQIRKASISSPVGYSIIFDFSVGHNIILDSSTDRYWLRSPYTEGNTEARCIRILENTAYYSRLSVTEQIGIRPLITVDSKLLNIVSGEGTVEDPFVLITKDDYCTAIKKNQLERFEENGLYGYKDSDGNVVVPAKYAKALPFSDGAALVATIEDPYHWRYIDTTGNYLFDKAFYASNNFNNGYALVLVTDDPKYSYIDKTGEFATEILFDDAEDFCGGYARVKVNGKWGVIDTNFNFKVPCEYDSKDEVLGKLDLS